MECIRFKQNISRESIFAIADNIEEFDMNWKDDILKYFSVDELKDFFEDFTRLRDMEVSWQHGTVYPINEE